MPAGLINQVLDEVLPCGLGGKTIVAGKWLGGFLEVLDLDEVETFRVGDYSAKVASVGFGAEQVENGAASCSHRQPLDEGDVVRF